MRNGNQFRYYKFWFFHIFSPIFNVDHKLEVISLKRNILLWRNKNNFGRWILLMRSSNQFWYYKSWIFHQFLTLIVQKWEVLSLKRNTLLWMNKNNLRRWILLIGNFYCWLYHGGWRSRYHSYRKSAAQDGPNGRLYSSFSFFFRFWLIKAWCASNLISDLAARIDEFS